MSNLPPANPFGPNASYAPIIEESGGQMSGFTKAILILFLVLGILGIFASLMAGVQLVIGAVVSASMEGQADGDGAQVPNVNLNVFPGAIALQIAMQIVGFIISVCMVIAAVKGLKHQLSGLNLLRWTAVGLIVYKVAEQLLGIIVTFSMFDQIKAQMMEQIDKGPNPPPFDVGQVVDIVLYVLLGLGILWTIGMIVLYLVCYLHAGKPAVRAKFH